MRWRRVSPITSLFPSPASFEGRRTPRFGAERLDGSEGSFEGDRLDRRAVGAIPPIAESIHHPDHPVKLPRYAGQQLGVALPVDLTRKGDNVPADCDPNRIVLGQQDGGDQAPHYLVPQLLVGAEEYLQQVAAAHDAGDPATLVDHDEAAHVPLLHVAGSLAQARVERDG